MHGCNIVLPTLLQRQDEYHHRLLRLVQGSASLCIREKEKKDYAVRHSTCFSTFDCESLQQELCTMIADAVLILLLNV